MITIFPCQTNRTLWRDHAPCRKGKRNKVSGDDMFLSITIISHYVLQSMTKTASAEMFYYLLRDPLVFGRIFSRVYFSTLFLNSMRKIYVFIWSYRNCIYGSKCPTKVFIIN